MSLMLWSVQPWYAFLSQFADNNIYPLCYSLYAVDRRIPGRMWNVKMLMLATHEHHFNLRHCMLVVGMFGVITIISYFNELAK